MTREDRGSASVWIVAGCLLLFLVGAVGTVRGAAVLARHRAEAAADLAALAAATRIGTRGDPCDSARRIAGANGARLERCSVDTAADGRSGKVDVAATVRLRLPVLGSRHAAATARAGRLRAATSGAEVSQHEVEQRHRAGLVQRLVAVAALG